MTLKQAISTVNKRSRNINLHWFICKWNNGYIIHSSTYMRHFPDTEYVYSTGPLNKIWELEYRKDLKRFIHVVK